MLYEMTKELSAYCISKGFPFPIEYGPLAVRTNAIARTHVIVERDRGVSEAWNAPHGSRLNAPQYFSRIVAGKATIYAASTVTGARSQDHERLADKIADMIASGLYTVIRGRRLIEHTMAGRMVPAADLENEGLQQWPGAIYQLTFTVSRAVPAVNWAGEGLPTGNISGVVTHSEVTDWIPDSVLPAEDACASHYPPPEGD